MGNIHVIYTDIDWEIVLFVIAKWLDATADLEVIRRVAVQQDEAFAGWHEIQRRDTASKAVI